MSDDRRRHRFHRRPHRHRHRHSTSTAAPAAVAAVRSSRGTHPPPEAAGHLLVNKRAHRRRLPSRLSTLTLSRQRARAYTHTPRHTETRTHTHTFVRTGTLVFRRSHRCPSSPPFRGKKNNSSSNSRRPARSLSLPHSPPSTTRSRSPFRPSFCLRLSRSERLYTAVECACARNASSIPPRRVRLVHTHRCRLFAYTRPGLTTTTLPQHRHEPPYRDIVFVVVARVIVSIIRRDIAAARRSAVVYTYTRARPLSVRRISISRHGATCAPCPTRIGRCTRSSPCPVARPMCNGPRTRT